MGMAVWATPLGKRAWALLGLYVVDVDAGGALIKSRRDLELLLPWNLRLEVHN